MRRRVLAAACGFWTVLAALALAVPAVAQQGTTVTFTTRASAAVADALQRGRELELERRWGDALSHYEDAMRQHPNDATLQRRFEYTRLHYDLGRRYVDRSFCDALGTLPFGKALETYSQVLLKIQSHYVEVPNWKALLDHGTNNFEVALSEPAFVERNIAERSRAEVDEFRAELRRTLGAWSINTREQSRDAVAAAAQLAQKRLGVRPTAVVLEYLCGATNSLDPYSAYLTPDQLNEVYAQIDGNFVGLGVELKANQGNLLIVRVIAGSPAEDGGIRAGDQILAVDGQSVREFSTDKAANMLQGEEGSTVRLTVASPGQTQRELTIRRRRVDVPSVDQPAIIDSERGIAYFKLTCFQKTTARDVDAALWKLHREGMKSLIVDLRGNPGGLLLSSVEVANRFIDRGVIVSTRGRSPQEDFTYLAHPEGAWRVPLVLLIDQYSASAAEIFAGAIRDHRRGTVVGARSYGKGSVQGIFPLDACSAGVRLTTAKFYSPNGHPYSNVGVEPDVAVHTTVRPVDGQPVVPESAGDSMLAAALEAARNPAPTR